jgi:hypothetical protein
MRFIDPLKQKMHNLLESGRAIPLNHARMSYGSIADYERLADKIRSDAGNKNVPVVIDLTPLERLGNGDALAEKLKPLAAEYLLTFLCNENAVLETTIKAGIQHLAQIIIYDSKGQFLRVDGLQANKVAAETARNNLKADGNISATRQHIAHAKLLALLSPKGVIHAYPGCGLPRDDIVWLDGRWYLRMPNRMLVTCYLNMKEALKRPVNLTTISYEVVYALYNYFRREPPIIRPCDVIVVPSNIALLVGAAVQSFTEIPVCVIDKLGPIPSKHLAQTHASIPLRDKRICLLVEVSATGSELDRTILYLSSQKAQVQKVIVCYNLEVGRSMLTEHVEFTSLCCPKKDLGYVYRSD